MSRLNDDSYMNYYIVTLHNYFIYRYTAGSLNQRDQSRTQLFGSFKEQEETPVSAYGNGNNKSKFDYSQSSLAQLESQSTDQMNIMGQKLKALKHLSLKMGDEIRGSNETVNNLNDTFHNTTVKLKSTFNNMMDMASRSGVSIKIWLLIFFVVAVLFFWVWIS